MAKVMVNPIFDEEAVLEPVNLRSPAFGAPPGKGAGRQSTLPMFILPNDDTTSTAAIHTVPTISVPATSVVPSTIAVSSEQCSVMPEPDENSDKHYRKQYLRWQLDTLNDRELLDGLVLQDGPDGRANGGAIPTFSCKARSHRSAPFPLSGGRGRVMYGWFVGDNGGMHCRAGGCAVCNEQTNQAGGCNQVLPL